MPGHDGELEIVVDHPVVLARRLQVAHERPVAGPQELGGILANRLAAERFFVAHVARGSQFRERGADHKLRHRIGPHRLHEQRRHQHVTAKVGRIRRQAGHQLFVRAEQLEASHFALQPPILGERGKVEK